MSRYQLWLMYCVLGIILTGITSNTGYCSKEILIGGTVSLEGKFAEPSLMGQEAFNFWAQEVNKRGGLLGRKVRLLLYDNKSDVQETQKLYKKLIEEDKVDLVFAPYSTPLTISASKICEPHKKLMLAIAAASKKPWKLGARYLFQIYAPADRQFVGLLDIMARKNLNKVAVVYNDLSAFNTDMANGVHNWAKKFKLEVTYSKSYQDGPKELPAILKEVQNSQVDCLIHSSYPPDSYALLEILQEMNYRPRVLGMPIVPVHPDFKKKVGSMSNLVFGPSQWEPDERIPFPGTEKFIAGFKNFTGHAPSFHATSAYSACQLLERAIIDTGSFDNTKLRDYIAALDTVTVLGRFKVDPTGLQVGHNSFLIQWQNGKKEIVWPRKMQTSQPQL